MNNVRTALVLARGVVVVSSQMIINLSSQNGADTIHCRPRVLVMDSWSQFPEERKRYLMALAMSLSIDSDTRRAGSNALSKQFRSGTETICCLIRVGVGPDSRTN